MVTRIVVRIVKDEPCPKCGAMWGHPDPKLNYPNRPKVDDWWRCYNPNCPVDLYRPDTGAVILRRESR